MKISLEYLVYSTWFLVFTKYSSQVDLKHMHQEPGNNVVTMAIDLTEFYLSLE